MIYGFIGLGNMAGAIIRGMRASEAFRDLEVCGFEKHPEKARALNVLVFDSLAKFINFSDVIVLAVKPQALEPLLAELKSLLRPDKLLVSIAAGKPIDWYETACPGIPFVRVMPNINAAVGAGVTAVCGGSRATPEHVRIVRELFQAVGSVYELPESRFSVFSAVAGAAPAYTCLYMDALASAAVRAGLPRAMALSIAEDMVLGSAKYLKESELHPLALADQVCSPGGTTIEGMHKLRELGFEHAVYQAIAAVIEKDRRIGG